VGTSSRVPREVEPDYVDDEERLMLFRIYDGHVMVKPKMRLTLRLL
jgi:hypothetical protein